jgi:TetR/AcrR family fatty acid metabolism transcriptional regulator
MTKQKILKSAIKILDSHSFSNTTARMIANEANIAVGSIYNHYKNKEDILNYLFDSEYIKRVQYFNFLDSENLTNLDKLLAFVEFHFLELKLNESLAKVLIRESSNPDLANLDGIRKFNCELPSKISKIIINAKEANEKR